MLRIKTTLSVFILFLLPVCGSASEMMNLYQSRSLIYFDVSLTYDELDAQFLDKFFQSDGLHDGIFRSYEGYMLLDPYTDRIEYLTFSIDIRSLFTDNEENDLFFKGPAVFDVDFNSTDNRLIFESSEISESSRGNLTAFGAISIGLISRPVTIELPVQVATKDRFGKMFHYLFTNVATTVELGDYGLADFYLPAQMKLSMNLLYITDRYRYGSKFLSGRN